MAQDKLAEFEKAMRLESDALAKYEQATKEVVSCQKREQRRKLELDAARKATAQARAELSK